MRNLFASCWNPKAAPAASKLSRETSARLHFRHLRGAPARMTKSGTGKRHVLTLVLFVAIASLVTFGQQTTTTPNPSTPPGINTTAPSAPSNPPSNVSDTPPAPQQPNATAPPP